MACFWGILNREHYYGRRFTRKPELVQMIEHYIHGVTSEGSGTGACLSPRRNASSTWQHKKRLQRLYQAILFSHIVFPCLILFGSALNRWCFYFVKCIFLT